MLWPWEFLHTMFFHFRQMLSPRKAKSLKVTDCLVCLSSMIRYCGFRSGPGPTVHNPTKKTFLLRTDPFSRFTCVWQLQKLNMAFRNIAHWPCMEDLKVAGCTRTLGSILLRWCLCHSGSTSPTFRLLKHMECKGGGSTIFWRMGNWRDLFTYAMRPRWLLASKRGWQTAALQKDWSMTWPSKRLLMLLLQLFSHNSCPWRLFRKWRLLLLVTMGRHAFVALSWPLWVAHAWASPSSLLTFFAVLGTDSTCQNLLRSQLKLLKKWIWRTLTGEGMLESFSMVWGMLSSWSDIERHCREGPRW